jgi:copper chaperone
MKKIEIQIPNMQNSHCQMRVSTAMKTIEGTTVEKMEPGKITISIENDTKQNEAIRAIENLGYTIGQIN